MIGWCLDRQKCFTPLIEPRFSDWNVEKYFLCKEKNRLICRKVELSIIEALPLMRCDLIFSDWNDCTVSASIFRANFVCGGCHPTSQIFKRTPFTDVTAPVASRKYATENDKQNFKHSNWWLKSFSLPSLVNLLNGCNISTNDKLFLMQISSADGLHTAAISGENTFCTISLDVKFCAVKWIILQNISRRFQRITQYTAEHLSTSLFTRSLGLSFE